MIITAPLALTFIHSLLITDFYQYTWSLLFWCRIEYTLWLKCSVLFAPSSTFYCECLFVLQAFHRLGTFHPLPRVCRQVCGIAGIVVIAAQPALAGPLWSAAHLAQLPVSCDIAVFFFTTSEVISASPFLQINLSGLCPWALWGDCSLSWPASRLPGLTGWWL